MDFFYTLLSLLTSLLLLNLVIMIHELGHYFTAYYSGMIAQEVSVGFGKVLYSIRDSKGTMWSLRLWPLGGYVDLYGTKTKQQSMLFHGIICNLFAAFLVLTLCFTSGFDQKKLIVHSVTSNSPAMQAGLQPGDRLVAIDNTPLKNWELTQLRFILYTTSYAEHTLTYQREGKYHTTTISSANWPMFGSNNTILSAFGILPIHDPLSLTVSAVAADSAASLAGLRPGDTIQALNGEPVVSVSALIKSIRSLPGEHVTLRIARNHNTYDLSFVVDKQGWLLSSGVLGARFNPTIPYSEMYQYQSYPLLESATLSLETIGYYLLTSFVVLAYLITGKLTLSMLAGPVFIISQTQQFLHYKLFIALMRWFAAINICLAFANLIPLPMLDGGQWCILCIEKLRGKPLSNNTKEWLYALCFGFLVALMTTITLLDISRILCT